MEPISLVAVLLLVVGLVFVVRQTATTRDRIETPAMGQDGAGGSDLTRDPYIKHHAEVVPATSTTTPGHLQGAKPAPEGRASIAIRPSNAMPRLLPTTTGATFADVKKIDTSFGKIRS
jgi:hypothetical protein